MFAALNATNEAILRANGPEELFQRVCDAAVFGGGFKSAGALLADSDEWLRIAAAADISGKAPPANLRISVNADSEYGRGVAGTAFRAGRSCISNDYQNDERFQPWRQESIGRGIGAAAAVPILKDGRSIGVFLFYLAETGSLTDQIVGLMERMVENVAFALRGFEQEQQRQRAERVTRRVSDMFKALSATNTAILRARNVEEMFQQVCDSVTKGGRSLGAAAIFVSEPGSSLLKFAAASGELVEYINSMRLSVDPADPHGGGLHGPAFREQKLVITCDTLADPRTKLWASPDAKPHGCAAVPLVTNGRSVGILFFFFGRTSGKEDEGIHQLMIDIAANVSFGLEMFKREDLRRSVAKEQDNLHRMYVALSTTNEAIMRSRTREELLELVCSAAVLGGKFTSTTIALAEPGQEFLRIAATKGENAERVRSTRFAISAERPEGRGSTGTSFRTKRPCIINDYLTDERTKHWHTLAGEGGTKSGASFPLLKGSEATGVLLFLSSEKDAFTDELVDLLARLAENISFALENFDRDEQKRQADEQIQYLATHDALTGLPNRAMFNELLDLSIKSARRNRSKCAVLFIDLDHFKIINDTLGHAAGDSLLIQVGQRLRSSVRESDVVVRLGGDEFIIILSEISHRDQAALIAGKVLSSVSAGIVLAGHESHTTASIGIAVFPSDGTDVESLTKNADMAMYLAKEHGKNEFRFFENEMDASVAAHNKLGQELRNALTAGQFEVHYQPIISIDVRRTVGMEALVRWRHPERGLMSPDKFIPLAEETQLIDRLGELVLRQACSDAIAWPPEINVAVNVSPVQFRSSDLASRVASILVETGLPAKRLELEITESVLLQHSEKNLAALHELRALGVSIALDDFGTGYSSLSYLRTFPFDKIKIDRSFVSEMSRMDVCAAIVCAVANLGRSLEITTTAEGVETKEQLELVRAAGCTQAQGYLFARPCAVSELKFDDMIDWAPAEKGEPLTARDIMLLRTSFSLIVPIQDTIASLFYDRLFVIAPEVRRLFPDDLAAQKRKLVALLATCIGRVHDFDALAPVIWELGKRHAGYGARQEHYAVVAEALLWALANGLGIAFVPEVRSAWAKVYSLLAKMMQAGAADAVRATLVGARSARKS
jgi:diguanylate cyclase (GGDEF)-like protein